MTWVSRMTRGWAYPRFGLERDIWLKFKAHCVGKDRSVESSIRKLIIRYLKGQKLIEESVPDDKESVFSTKNKIEMGVIKEKGGGLDVKDR